MATNRTYIKKSTCYFRDNRGVPNVLIERRYFDPNNSFRTHYDLSVRVTGSTVTVFFVDCIGGGGYTPNPHEVPVELLGDLLEILGEASALTAEGASLPNGARNYRIEHTNESNPVDQEDAGS